MDMWSVHWKENCEEGRQISELGAWVTAASEWGAMFIS